jgi:hypothetical protein
MQYARVEDELAMQVTARAAVDGVEVAQQQQVQRLICSDVI